MTPRRLAEIQSLANEWQYNRIGLDVAVIRELLAEVDRLWRENPPPLTFDPTVAVHVIDPAGIGFIALCGDVPKGELPTPDVPHLPDRILACQAVGAERGKLCPRCVGKLKKLQD